MSPGLRQVFAAVSTHLLICFIASFPLLFDDWNISASSLQILSLSCGTIRDTVERSLRITFHSPENIVPS